MANLWIEQLKCDTRGYYYALISGIKLSKYKKKVQRSIDILLYLGVKREYIEDIMSDNALEIC